jgi:hypothetical protein
MLMVPVFSVSASISSPALLFRGDRATILIAVIRGSVMLIQKVGEAAGLIWLAIDSQGPLKMTALKKQLKLNDTILNMALGWLAREDKIEMTASGRTFLVQLK